MTWWGLHRTAPTAGGVACTDGNHRRRRVDRMPLGGLMDIRWQWMTEGGMYVKPPYERNFCVFCLGMKLRSASLFLSHSCAGLARAMAPPSSRIRLLGSGRMHIRELLCCLMFLQPTGRASFRSPLALDGVLERERGALPGAVLRLVFPMTAAVPPQSAGGYCYVTLLTVVGCGLL